jgi:hypothetical protein
LNNFVSTKLIFGETQFSQRGLVLLLPSALNLTLVIIMEPILNAILARTDNPEIAIGGFAISFGLIGLIGLPQLRVQHLTLIFLQDTYSLRALRIFVIRLAIIASLITLIIGITPLSTLIFGAIFSTDTNLQNEAEISFLWMMPVPALMIIKMYLYGIALRIERPIIVWIGLTTSVVSICAIASALLFLDIQGSQIAAISVTFGNFIELGLMLFSLVIISLNFEKSGKHIKVTQFELTKFFAPLLIVAFLPAFSKPFILALVSHTSESTLSLAAFPLAMGIFTFFTFLVGGLTPTILALMNQGEDLKKITRFSIRIGLVSWIFIALIVWIPSLSNFLISDLIGVSGRLHQLTLVALKILSVLPLIMVIEQIFAATLLQHKQVKKLVFINIGRLASLIIFALLINFFTGFNGATIGAIAVLVTLSVESILAIIFGYQYFFNPQVQESQG